MATALALLSWLRLLFTIGAVLFLGADRRRRLYQKGSMERYREACTCRLLMITTILWGPMGVAYQLMAGLSSTPALLFLIPIDLFLGYYYGKKVLEFLRDDEDDFWNRFKKKLKSKAKALQAKWAARPSLLPSPLPAPTA